MVSVVCINRVRSTDCSIRLIYGAGSRARRRCLRRARCSAARCLCTAQSRRCPRAMPSNSSSTIQCSNALCNIGIRWLRCRSSPDFYWTSFMPLFAPKTPLADLAAMLDAGTTTSRELTETALERIAADGGNGGAAFCFVDADGARRQADALDALRRAGTRLSPLAGVPVSVKDLFDVQGQPTRAGSRVLARSEERRVGKECSSRW